MGAAQRPAVTRAQLQQLLTADEDASESGMRSDVAGRFPRSATFRLLLSGRNAARSGLLLWCAKAFFNRVLQSRQ